MSTDFDPDNLNPEELKEISEFRDKVRPYVDILSQKIVDILNAQIKLIGKNFDDAEIFSIVVCALVQATGNTYIAFNFEKEELPGSITAFSKDLMACTLQLHDKKNNAKTKH